MNEKSETIEQKDVKKIDIKKYLKKYYKEILLLLVLIISVANIIFSFYVFQNSSEHKLNITSSVVTENLNNPKVEKAKNNSFGMRHEVYSKYEDGKWNVYTNDEPMSKEDFEEIRQDFIEKQKAMDEYFRKQRELMNEMWNMFP